MVNTLTNVILVGISLGVLTAIHTVIFFRIAFAIRNKTWRRIWAYSYLAHVWLIVRALRWVYSTPFSEISSRTEWHYFVGSWLLPYGISVAWCVWTYRDRIRKPEDSGGAS